MATASPSTNGSRKTNGQFGDGNKYGKGNPHGQKVAQLRTAMMEAITSEDIQAIVGALITKAKEGDIPAIKILLPYMVGLAPQAINPDDVELEEMRLESRYIDLKGQTDRKRSFGPM